MTSRFIFQRKNAKIFCVTMCGKQLRKIQNGTFRILQKIILFRFSNKMIPTFIAILLFATQYVYGLESSLLQIDKPISMRLPVPTLKSKSATASIISQGAQTKVRFDYEEVKIKLLDSQLVMMITWKPDIHTLKDIYADLDLTDHRGVLTQNQNYFSQGAVFKKNLSDGTLIEFDLGIIWNGALGNRVVYILSPDGKYGALRLAPTGPLEFDWNQLSIRWK
jgi:hypothetical protein